MGSEAGQDNANISTDIDQLRARDEAIRDGYYIRRAKINRKYYSGRISP